MKFEKVRRALAVLLSLSMCVGLLTTSAFAADRGHGNGSSGSGSNNPSTSGDEEVQENLKNTVYVYLNVGEGSVTEEEAPSMPSFEVPDDSLVQEVEDAKKELEEAQVPDEFQPETTLDPDAVGSAPTFSEDLDAAESAKAEKEKELDEAKAKLDEQKTELESTLTSAESAVSEADKAISSAGTKKTELENKLNQALADLEASVPEKPGELADYETYDAYLAAVEGYNAKVEAYNTARNSLETQYQQAEKELEAEVEKALKAKDDAESAVKEAKEKLAAFNEAVNGYNEGAEEPQEVTDYNEAVGEYNDAVKEYDEAVGEYNKTVEQYNGEVKDYNDSTAVKEYNDKVDAYNEAKEQYDQEFGDYQDAVKAYDEEALAWNADKTDKNSDAVIDALLDGNTLLESKYAEITVTKEQTDVFDQVNSGKKSTDSLTQDEVDAYNAVVRAYNAAVEKYNASVVDDFEKLVLSDKRFEGQTTTIHKSDTEANAWLTIGKVTVEGVFTESPSTIRDEAAGVDGGGNDFSSNTTDRDVYYWEKNSETGEWSAVPAGSKAEENFETYLNGGIEGLEDALSSSDNLTYLKSGDDSVDLNAVTTKWVLKATAGANDYTDEVRIDGKSQYCWHLDGYLKVMKLAQLAELAKVPEKVDYNAEARIEQAFASTKTPLTETALMDGLEWNAPEEMEARGDWTVEAPSYSGAALNADAIPTDSYETIVPEPTPAPTTEPTPPPTTEPTPPPTTEPTPPPTSEPVVEIPDPMVPLDELPDEVEIPDEEVPLDELPDEVEIPDEEVPLTDLPDDLIEIEDEDVPLADVPQTGDISAAWYLALPVSAAGLLALTTLERKRRQDE